MCEQSWIYIREQKYTVCAEKALDPGQIGALTADSWEHLKSTYINLWNKKYTNEGDFNSVIHTVCENGSVTRL